MNVALRPAILAVALLTAVTGCAQTVGPGAPPSDSVAAPAPVPAAGEVLGQGTVLQKDDAPPEFCLGAVAESYPPQCGGPELVGWDWETVDGEENANSVTWGTYAVQGTWDGLRLTVTQPPIMLALYDAMPIEIPELDPANAGATSETDLVRIQQELTDDKLFEILTSVPQNGYLFISVVYDDGDVQRYVDERYGEDVVVIQSALRPVG